MSFFASGTDHYNDQSVAGYSKRPSSGLAGLNAKLQQDFKTALAR
jgi:hypothetical protein